MFTLFNWVTWRMSAKEGQCWETGEYNAWGKCFEATLIFLCELVKEARLRPHLRPTSSVSMYQDPQMNCVHAKVWELSCFCPLLNLLYSFICYSPCFPVLYWVDPFFFFFFLFTFPADPYKHWSLQLQLTEDSDHQLMHLLMEMNLWKYWSLVPLGSS